jgi:biopolymer transport protein ExbD
MPRAKAMPGGGADMTEKKTRNRAAEEVEMQMTPLIDVTFLLLIFFLCSIKFKMLDGKLAAYLPRNEGVNPSPVVEPFLEKINIHLARKESAPLGFMISVNNTRMSGLEHLYWTLKQYLHQDSNLEATCHPGNDIQYGHVVKVVNECMRAELENLTFSALPWTR